MTLKLSLGKVRSARILEAVPVIEVVTIDQMSCIDAGGRRILTRRCLARKAE